MYQMVGILGIADELHGGWNLEAGTSMKGEVIWVRVRSSARSVVSGVEEGSVICRRGQLWGVLQGGIERIL